MYRTGPTLTDKRNIPSGEGTDMSRRRSRLLALPFVATLAIASALAGAAGAVGTFDGTYRGDQTILRSNNGPDCMNRNDKVIVVRDDHFDWIDNRVFDTVIVKDVAITADGSFSKWGSAWGLDGEVINPVKIEGEITGHKLDADIDEGNSCISHLSLTKS